MYHDIIMARLEKILEIHTKNFIDNSEDSSPHFLSRNTPLLKMGAIEESKFEPESILATNEINVITHHANEINKNQMMRKSKIMQNNDQRTHKEEDDKDPFPREYSHMYNHTHPHDQTQNLIFIEQKVDKNGNEVEFDKNFIL